MNVLDRDDIKKLSRKYHQWYKLDRSQNLEEETFKIHEDPAPEVRRSQTI